MKKKTAKKLAKIRRGIEKRFKRHHLLAICLLFLVVVSGIGAYLHFTAPQGRLVTFHDRGRDKVILTNATTVRDALADANIAYDPKDDVEPTIDSTLNTTDSAVIIYRARPVLIVDGATRVRALTPAQSANEIAMAANLKAVDAKDETKLAKGNFIADGADTILTIKRAAPPPPAPAKQAFAPTAQTLTRSKGAQIYTDTSGVAHRETYYDLPMNIVIRACGGGGYTIRYDGAKVDKDGYVLVAANLSAYPRCSVVETSMGPGKVYDTGGFALRYRYGFDLATDWSNNDGR